MTPHRSTKTAAMLLLVLATILLPGQPARAQDAQTPALSTSESDAIPNEGENTAVDDATARSNGEESDTPDDAAADDEIDAMSGSLDDSAGSIESGRDTRGDSREWDFQGDLRVGYTRTDKDFRDGTEGSESEWRGRFRFGGTYGVEDTFIAGARLASPCSTENCDPEFVLDGTLPNSTSINDGDITFDQLYIHSFRRERFDIAIGRLQTKFVSRAGVFAKSLDRNDSPGSNVSWTDGAHGILHINEDWTGHVILQKNQANGTGNIRRGPIDFNHEDSRITYFAAAENFRRFGPINQQGFDITYMPRSLMKDGDRSGRIEDYIALVGRFAASWPEGSTDRRLNIAGEIGYAPETPTRASMGLTGAGDTDGLAWLVSVSLVDFRPDHSVGVNYGQADAGYLLSPQYRENERATEVRYVWRRSRNLAIDLRARWREELEQQISTTRKREELNVFARFTWGFGY